MLINFAALSLQWIFQNEEWDYRVNQIKPFNYSFIFAITRLDSSKTSKLLALPKNTPLVMGNGKRTLMMSCCNKFDFKVYVVVHPLKFLGNAVCWYCFMGFKIPWLFSVILCAMILNDAALFLLLSRISFHKFNRPRWFLT